MSLLRQALPGNDVVMLGVSQDAAETLLWRVAHTKPFLRSKPKISVVLIGTNNIGASGGVDPQITTRSILSVVEQLKRDYPGVPVFLLGVLPRGLDADDPARRTIEAVNVLLRDCAVQFGYRFGDISAGLLENGKQRAELILPDRVHLKLDGYRVITANLASLLTR